MNKINGEYQHKGFAIVEAGKDEVFITRFSDSRIELKSYYKILGPDNKELPVGRKLWTIAQAQRFIDEKLKNDRMNQTS